MHRKIQLRESKKVSEQWPKCWGRNTEIFRNSSVSVNLLELIKGGVCSWHFHAHKHNKFYVVSGKVRIKTEHGEVELSPGLSFTVSSPLKHLFEALEDSKVIEVMYVEYDHSDINREIQGFLKKGEGDG